MTRSRGARGAGELRDGDGLGGAADRVGKHGQSLEAPDVFTGRCPSCGSLDVELSDDSQPVKDWTCWACGDAWGVRAGVIV